MNQSWNYLFFNFPKVHQFDLTTFFVFIHTMLLGIHFQLLIQDGLKVLIDNLKNL